MDDGKLHLPPGRLLLADSIELLIRDRSVEPRPTFCDSGRTCFVTTSGRGSEPAPGHAVLKFGEWAGRKSTGHMTARIKARAVRSCGFHLPLSCIEGGDDWRDGPGHKWRLPLVDCGQIVRLVAKNPCGGRTLAAHSSIGVEDRGDVKSLADQRAEACFALPHLCVETFSADGDADRLAERSHEVQVSVGQVYLVTALHVQGADDPTRFLKVHTDLGDDAGIAPLEAGSVRSSSSRTASPMRTTRPDTPSITETRSATRS